MGTVCGTALISALLTPIKSFFCLMNGGGKAAHKIYIALKIHIFK